MSRSKRACAASTLLVVREKKTRFFPLFPPPIFILPLLQRHHAAPAAPAAAAPAPAPVPGVGGGRGGGCEWIFEREGVFLFLIFSRGERVGTFPSLGFSLSLPLFLSLSLFRNGQEFFPLFSPLFQSVEKNLSFCRPLARRGREREGERERERGKGQLGFFFFLSQASETRLARQVLCFFAIASSKLSRRVFSLLFPLPAAKITYRVQSGARARRGGS